jgi:spermidine synthase
MSKKKPLELLEFESPWISDPGIVRVPKCAEDGDADDLLQGVYRNQTTRPYIVENMHERRLHFTHNATQSAMLIDDPDALVTAYTRKMMSFLLFNPNPKHILMIGLGGGSLPKFCYRQLSETQITVVEINKDVIALREEFYVPKDNARFRVVHDDGANYVERLTDPVDVILVDAFDADGIALSLVTSRFYSRAAAQLTPEGVLVMNFLGQGCRYVDNIRAIRAAFGKHVLLVPVASGENLLLFALKQPPPQSITAELESLAGRLQSRLQLEFPRYLRRICQGHSLAHSL